MKEPLVCLLVLLALFFIPHSSSEKSYRGHQVWRVLPASDQVLRILKEIGDTFEQVDFWKEPVGIGRPVDFRVPPSQIEGVRNYLGSRDIFDYEVYIPDIQVLIELQKTSGQQKSTRHKRAARSVVKFDYSVYHSPDEIYEWIDMVATEFPDIATKVQIGVTYQGRKMYALEFKKAATNAKPSIFIDSLIHSREWITTASLMLIFKQILTNKDYSHMLDDADWYFVPMINIDGYVETWTGDRLWRKTRSTGPNSICTGVDANRNWDAFWSISGASEDACHREYYGPSSFSESEVRHLASYATKFQGKIDAFVSTHSYSQMILYPYAHVTTPSPDDAELNVVAKMMSDAIRKVHGTEYVYGPWSKTLYLSSGTTLGWTYSILNVTLSYTFELRDTGKYGFLLPPENIIPNGEEYLAGLVELKNYVVDHFDNGSGAGL